MPLRICRCGVRAEEVTAYIFDGLVADWDLSAGDIGVFAAAFPAGCVVGSLASTARPVLVCVIAGAWMDLLPPAHARQVLLDRYGRRQAMVVGSCAQQALPPRISRSPSHSASGSARHAHYVYNTTGAAALAGALSAAAPSFALLVAARAVQAASWALAQAAATTWYAEFLPSRGRGPLLAAVSVGWPVGRGFVIAASALLGWRPARRVESVCPPWRCHSSPPLPPEGFGTAD